MQVKNINTRCQNCKDYMDRLLKEQIENLKAKLAECETKLKESEEKVSQSRQEGISYAIGLVRQKYITCNEMVEKYNDCGYTVTFNDRLFMKLLDKIEKGKVE